MARKRRVTKVDRLLMKLQRKGTMTHKEMVKFLLWGTNNHYNSTTRKYYDGTLYGRGGAPGFLHTHCRLTAFGVYAARD